MVNSIRTGVLLALLTALLLVIGAGLGGRVGVMIALCLALVMNFSAYWFSDQWVLKMYRAQAVGPYDAPELYSIVKMLSEKAELPMPKVYLISDTTPNAFATGRNPEHAAVAATTGIIQLLSRDELTGVMAHELTHVRHRDTLIGTIAATLAGAIGMLASMAQWAAIFGMGRRDEDNGHGSLIGTMLMAIIAPIAASLIQMAVSRSREFAADRGGALLCGHPLWLANALRRLETANRRSPVQGAEEQPATAHLFIVNPLSGKQVMHLFSTHPPLELRIQRLQAMAKDMGQA